MRERLSSADRLSSDGIAPDDERRSRMRSITKWLSFFSLAVLCATAVAPTAAVAVTTGPQVTLSRTYMSFADLCLGGTAGPLCFTITNSGGSDLHISSIGIINCSSSIDPMYIDCTTVAGFQITSGGAPGTVAAGQSRTVCVSFTPHEAATFSGFVRILSDASPGTSLVELHGTGDVCPATVVSPAQATLSRTYMSFADLKLGGTAGPLCFTITNTGGAPLVINSIGVIN